MNNEEPIISKSCIISTVIAALLFWGVIISLILLTEYICG